MSTARPEDNEKTSTGLETEALHEYGDKNQVIVFSETGGNIVSWKYRGVNILYPQRKSKVAGEVKPNGGIYVCFPNFGIVDSRFGLPKHGSLCNRRADYVTNNGVFFRGRNLLGPIHNAVYQATIFLALQRDGFIYSVFAKRCEPQKQESKPVFVNAGLRTYFRTPMHEAVVTERFMPTSRIYQQRAELRRSLADQSVRITIPGLGMVQMHLFGALWEPAILKTIGLWRNSKEYLCVEHSLTEPRLYGKPICPRLTNNSRPIFGCKFEVKLA